MNFFVKILRLPGKTPALIDKPICKLFRKRIVFMALVINDSAIMIGKNPYFFLKSEDEKLLDCLFEFWLFASMDGVEFVQKIFECFLCGLAISRLFNIFEVLKLKK